MELRVGIGNFKVMGRRINYAQWSSYLFGDGLFEFHLCLPRRRLLLLRRNFPIKKTSWNILAVLNFWIGIIWVWKLLQTEEGDEEQKWRHHAICMFEGKRGTNGMKTVSHLLKEIFNHSYSRPGRRRPVEHLPAGHLRPGPTDKRGLAGWQNRRRGGGLGAAGNSTQRQGGEGLHRHRCTSQIEKYKYHF